MSQVIGFALALVIGLTLGMLGAGGSILTVPVFVYVMGMEAKSAIAMSLPVVGVTSLVAAAGHWRHGNVDWRTALVFGPLAMLGAVGGARLAGLVAGAFQLAVLGVVMIAAGLAMLRGRAGDVGSPRRMATLGRRAGLALMGLGVGVLTGFAGVGGGFIIVPALVLLGAIPMKRAVGTSLLIIAASTLTGLVALQGKVPIAWTATAVFAALMIVGTVVGTRLVRRVRSAHLRRAFGVLVLTLGAFLLYKSRAAILDARDGASKVERRDAATSSD